MTEVNERPVLGHGYQAFWTPEQVFEFSRIHDWAFSSAHSGYLETALDVGIVGATIFVAITIIICLTSVRMYFRTGDWSYMLVFSLICMGMVSATVDVMFVRAGFANIIIAAGTAMLCMQPSQESAIEPQGSQRLNRRASQAFAFAERGTHHGV